MEVTIMTLSDVVIDLRARNWCKLPYPDHPKGCPNYNKRESCPPLVALFEDKIEPPYILVGVKFNLDKWVKRMKEKHPEWSDRQARCCLYWQGKVRKILRKTCENICREDELIIYNPEGMGVHVFETCRRLGIKLKRNPRDMIWKIAIIGRKRND